MKDMEKVYNIVEFAEILGVSQVTVRNWIKESVIIPKTTPTGQMYFTEAQASAMFVNYRMKGSHKSKSSLYIICEENEDKVDSLIETCIKAQRKTYPNSVFIKDFTTFFSDQFSNISFDVENTGDMAVLKGCVLKELSTRLKDYVENRVLSILSIDEEYKKGFTWYELESLVLNENVDTELANRFDKVSRNISENPKDNQINMDGSVKLLSSINSGYLKVMIDSKVTDLATKLGLNGQALKGTNYRQLLDFDKVIDPKTYDILAAEDLQINVNAPFINTIIKDVLLKSKREVAKTKIIQLAEDGYFHVFRFVDSEACIRTLYGYLDEKSFKNVYLVGSNKDMLPREISLKLEVGKENGSLNYDII